MEFDEDHFNFLSYDTDSFLLTIDTDNVELTDPPYAAGIQPVILRHYPSDLNLYL